MKILSIETSCDETAVAVIQKNESGTIQILSESISSSSSLHAKTGGIIPEFAAREQIKSIIPLIVETLLQLNKTEFTKITQKEFELASSILSEQIDAIAVTFGPGLIGSLLVGVETAKTLSLIHKKPLIPVNHLLGHLYANFVDRKDDLFPFVGLIVSGGHTDLLYFSGHDSYEWLGGTRDDAAGEALDKTGRLLNLSYPAGPEIEARAGKVGEPTLKFQSPLIHEDTYDFSFSGLKTEVLRHVQKEGELSDTKKNMICYAVQKAVIDVLVKKTIRAAIDKSAPTILLGGGVSANQKLRDTFLSECKKAGQITVLFPEKKLSTDNAVMIGARAAFSEEFFEPLSLRARPDLYFD